MTQAWNGKTDQRKRVGTWGDRIAPGNATRATDLLAGAPELTQAEVDALMHGPDVTATGLITPIGPDGVRYTPPDRASTYAEGTERARAAIAELRGIALHRDPSFPSTIASTDAASNPVEAILNALAGITERLTAIETALGDQQQAEPWAVRSIP
ncbi:hypothetical protein UFOVP1169_19 [uncultured Caudovirales phage]|uniref:Uncharacterized protein n=1 Tax=uncultured Caudovirales phage TaxID=2100421 RepID=A0A6J5R2U1_9CAUD|nr:hypothetical protein UFOVP1169_19 [uncultured Caudovirales phage]